MIKQKTTKRALATSVIALVLCVAMLLGTTYAWFTDSVVSGGNIIKSGTLNIDLGIKAKGDANYVSVKTDATKKAFNYDKWEPGYTEWVNAKVYTTGNLALKYTMKITANGTVSDLADVIDVYYAASEVALPATRPADLTAAGLTKIGTLKDALDGTVVINDTLIPDSNEADFATLALHMQESAGNEYQNLSIGTDFSLQILATQFTYEEDSFDDQYDLNSEWPGEKHVADAAEFKNAVTSGEVSTVVLSDDVEIRTSFGFGSAAGDKVIDLNGHTLTIVYSATACTVSGGSSLVLKNSGTTGEIIVQRTTPTTPGMLIAFKASGAGSSITVDDVNITQTGARTANSSIVLDAYNSGTMVVNGGQITSDETAIRAYGNSGTPGTVIINGGTIHGEYAGVLAGANGNVTINGGTVTGTADAIRYGGANTTVDIRGGSITATNGFAVNFTTTGSANKVLNIYGGTITAGAAGMYNETTGSTVNDLR